MNKILTDYFTIKSEHDKALAVVEKETQRIVNIIKKVFKRKNAWWAFDYYEPPSPELVEDGMFAIYISESCETNAVDCSAHFPVEFFDMTDAQSEQYLRKEIAADLAKEVEEARKADKLLKENKAEKAKLLESAKSKLSAAERKALGLK